MSWHVFALVWGDVFIERFARFVVPFLAMPGNLPALASDDTVVFHVYTNEASRGALEVALSPLEAYCSIDIRIFNDSGARRFSGPDFRYELQRGCLRDLARSLESGSLILLDSNFLLADGTLAALAARRRAGYRAVCVTFVRTATEPFVTALSPMLTSGASISALTLLRISLDCLHHITKSFFIDAKPFSPYPSQISWKVGDDGFVTRNFLPHPLMVPVADALQRSQSTMDYDLALRLAADKDIHVVRDSDEMLVVKFSDETHHAERTGEFTPTAEQLGLFLLACTNRRHVLFADTPAIFHCGDVDPRFAEAVAQSHRLLTDAYGWIDKIAAQPLDARLMMYFKSHLGPIEDFMSPQLEPAALARLIR